MLLDHLVSAAAADYVPELSSGGEDFTPLKDLSTAKTLNAQKKTSDWLQTLVDDDEEIIDAAQEEKVNSVFTAIVAQDPEAKEKALTLEMPQEVQQVTSMLTAYQWKFVEQAEELRSMAVTKIVKETEHPDARIRLKALEMLGKVTEVALFTDRIEVKREEMSDEELEAKIKEKLGKYMGIVDVVDAEVKDEDDETPAE